MTPARIDQCSEAASAADAFMNELRWFALSIDDASLTEGLDAKTAAYLLRVAEMEPGIRPVLAKAAALRRAAAPREPRRKPSTIYFVRAGQAGLIKIGSASNVLARIKLLQTGCPDELRLLGTLPGGVDVERRLHDRFAHIRTRGEWFDAADDLLHFIEALPR